MSLEITANVANSLNSVSVKNEASKKQEFQDVGEYEAYLKQKFGVNSGQMMKDGIATTINVDSAFIKKAYEDPEKRQFLERELQAMQSYDRTGLNPNAKVMSAKYNVDANGNITAEIIVMSKSESDGKGVFEMLKELLEKQAELREEKEAQEARKEALQGQDLKAQNAFIQNSFIQKEFKGENVAEIWQQVSTLMQNNIFDMSV